MLRGTILFDTELLLKKPFNEKLLTGIFILLYINDIPIMKRSVAYLPKRKQDDIRYFANYDSGKYITRDERIEFGIRTACMNDYDILVATHGIGNSEAGNKIEAVESKC